MDARWLLAALLTAGICGCAKTERPNSTGAAPEDRMASADSAVDADEVKVKLDQTPPVVQKTIERELAGGELEDISMQSAGGKAIYEVDMFRKEGGKLEIRVGDDGTVLSRKTEK